MLSRMPIMNFPKDKNLLNPFHRHFTYSIYLQHVFSGNQYDYTLCWNFSHTDYTHMTPLQCEFSYLLSSTNSY
jgi:hypothetical protein